MTKTLKITGGRPLVGEVQISGAKNAVTKAMIASLLTDEQVVLHNVPLIGDVQITAEIIAQVGGKAEFHFNGPASLRLQTSEVTSTTVEELSARNRIPILAISPLLHRVGAATVPVVGGDKIGARPVDFHLEALKRMGAEITQGDHVYQAKASGLRGADITLPYPSVGATENIVLAAVLAQGRTFIRGAAIEPEIIDLIKMLQQMGAIIEFLANRTIIIDGVKRLHGVQYTIMPDRLEAASYALMAVATNGDIKVKNARQEDLITFLNTLRRVGADYSVEEGGIRFKRGGELRGITLETDPHPGFATDWQQPMVVLLTQAKGRSAVHETVYENRLGYTEVLRRMGAQIEITDQCLTDLPCRFKSAGFAHSAVINGPTPLHATDIAIPDIRAGMAHVVAALIAQGESTLTGMEHLLRGYENLLDKLESVGARFTAE